MAKSWLEPANQAKLLAKSPEIRAICRLGISLSDKGRLWVSSSQDNVQGENPLIKTMCGLGVRQSVQGIGWGQQIRATYRQGVSKSEQGTSSCCFCCCCCCCSC